MSKKNKVRGVYEKVSGSGVWWIRFMDAEGILRREKVGSKSAAVALYSKRKTDAMEGKKLPKKLRARQVRFAELADDYLEHAKANNEGWIADKNRIATLKAAFGSRWRRFRSRIWGNGSTRRSGSRERSIAGRTVLRSIYKLGIENKKAESNPVLLLKPRKTPDGRVRFLSRSNRMKRADCEKCFWLSTRSIFPSSKSP